MQRLLGRRTRKVWSHPLLRSGHHRSTSGAETPGSGASASTFQRTPVPSDLTRTMSDRGPLVGSQDPGKWHSASRRLAPPCAVIPLPVELIENLGGLVGKIKGPIPRRAHPIFTMVRQPPSCISTTRVSTYISRTRIKMIYLPFWEPCRESEEMQDRGCHRFV
jgi:hypothetical protein